MKTRRVMAFLLAVCMILSFPLMGFAEEAASIPDGKLKSALRELLQKDASSELLPSELATLTGDIDLSDLGIKDIRGIEYLTEVSGIDLSGNDIETMSPKMDRMVKLERLDLSRNEKRYDFPGEVIKIPHLKDLSLAASKIRLVPKSLKEMTALENLDMSANRIDDFPSALLDMQLVNLNIDYNFLDLREGKSERNDIDNMSANVSGEYLAFRQFGRLENLTFYTVSGKIVVEWDGIDDIDFYDGTTASVQGYSVLVSGDYVTETGSSKRSVQIDAAPGTTYQVSVSPSYTLPQYGDFKIRSYTHIGGVALDVSGPALAENPDPVKYDNPYPTPTPTPVPTPTPEPTPTPTPSATVMTEVSPSPQSQGETDGFSGWFGSSVQMTLMMLAIILVLIAVIVVLLIVLLRNKSPKAKE